MAFMDTPEGFGRTNYAARFLPDLPPRYNLIRMPFGSPTLLSSVIASEAKQSIGATERKIGLLRRGACHRARVRATRWLLAMTAAKKESNDV
jgi:hypothetical protein